MFHLAGTYSSDRSSTLVEIRYSQNMSILAWDYHFVVAMAKKRATKLLILAMIQILDMTHQDQLMACVCQMMQQIHLQRRNVTTIRIELLAHTKYKWKTASGTSDRFWDL